MTDQQSSLADPEDFHRRHILMYNLMHELNRLLARLCRQPDPSSRRAVPLTVPLTLGLFLTALFLAPLAIFRYDPPESAWLYPFLGLAVFSTLATSEVIVRKVNSTLTLEEIEAFSSRQLWTRISVIPNQFLVACVVAIAILPFAFVLLLEIFGRPPAWPVFILIAITGHVWCHSSHIAIITSIRFSKAIEVYAAPLYAFNPEQSAFVASISDLYETILWTSAIALVVILSPLIFIQKTPLIVITGVAVSIVGFLVLIGLFLNAQCQLSKIVNAKKREVTTALQRRIEAFYAKAERLDSDNFSELQNLMTLHDQVFSARSWGLSATRTARFLSAFILPLITVFIANQEIITFIYNQTNALLNS